MIPAFPKSMIIDKERTKGGETTGSIDTTLKSPSINLVLSFTYTSTYANKRPINAEAIPTKNPTFNVFVMALLKFASPITLLKVSRVNPESDIKLSTSNIASGYNIKTDKKTIKSTMVVTMIGSARSFFLSRLAL
jgi:hypothetical protein